MIYNLRKMVSRVSLAFLIFMPLAMFAQENETGKIKLKKENLQENSDGSENKEKKIVEYNPQKEADNKNTEVKNEEKESTVTEKEITRKKIRVNKIQQLQQLEKDRSGKDIFGIGIAGFHGQWTSGSLTGCTNAQCPSDDFGGFGAGSLFDIQLAGGTLKKNGERSAGPWFWRWGARVQADFNHLSDESDTARKRIINALDFSFIIKHYFPMEEFAFSGKVPALNRFHFFLGVGPWWSIAIHDTIENYTDRTFRKGPTQTDFFMAFAVGFNFRISRILFLTADYRFGLNLSSEIEDEITGKIIDNTGEGGLLMSAHLGLAFAF